MDTPQFGESRPLDVTLVGRMTRAKRRMSLATPARAAEIGGFWKRGPRGGVEFNWLEVEFDVLA